MTTSRRASRFQLSRHLAENFGKIVALVLIGVIGVLVERYCQMGVSPFGPDGTIVAIDGDSPFRVAPVETSAEADGEPRRKTCFTRHNRLVD
jgi:hypothetical protein